MRIVAVAATRATVELSIDELVLVMDALWQELDSQAQHRGRRDENLRAGYEALQENLADVISEMDAAADDLPGPSSRASVG